MAQKVHEKPDTKGPYKGHLGHKGDIKAKMGIKTMAKKPNRLTVETLKHARGLGYIE